MRHLAGMLAVLPLLVLGACSADGSADEESSPADVLAAAKAALDETTGVALDLSTERIPDGVDGILAATGTGTHAPAFDGELTVLLNSLSVKVPVVAVDGLVYADLPFSRGFDPVDPEEYGAPDPAGLMDPDTGISSWLTAAEQVEEGEQVRDGDAVLTTYTASLPGAAVSTVIPSADEAATFTAEFLVDDDGRLVSAVVDGPFYADADPVTYTVDLSDYGTTAEIAAP